MVPIFIFWFMCKRQNTIFHGRSYQERKAVWDINDTISNFDKLRFGIDIIGRDWSNIIDAVQVHNSIVNIKIVRWIYLEQGWFKGNNDVASNENPVPSLVAFYIRDCKWNFLVSKGSKIHDTTRMVVEAITIKVV